MTSQGALTIVTSIIPDRQKELVHLLAKIQKDVESNLHVPFIKLTSIHFARWVVLERDMQGVKVDPPLLVFSSNFDDPLEQHLSEMVRIAGPGLENLYDCCQGFSKGQDQDIQQYLMDKRVPYSTFFAGTRGRSVKVIHEERELREKLEDFIDQKNAWGQWNSKSPEDIRRSILDFVNTLPKHSHLKQPLPQPGPFEKFKNSMGPVFLALAAILAPSLGFLIYFNGLGLGISVFVIGLIILLLGIVPLFLMFLNYLEKKETPANFSQIKHLKSLVDLEDHVVQNQMTILNPIKPGGVRNLILKLVLWAINLLAQRKFNKGRLGTISTIHFARWVIIDGRYLLFFSNYDGSWENYLGDFIDKAALGLTAIWSNGIGFPRTRWLIGQRPWDILPKITGGARNEPSFKAYTRQGQVATHVWYSAHKKLSVDNVLNNAKIRDGLSTSMNLQETKAWLRCFGRGETDERTD